MVSSGGAVVNKPGGRVQATALRIARPLFSRNLLPLLCQKGRRKERRKEEATHL
jgi:hypothetical protein